MSFERPPPPPRTPVTDEMTREQKARIFFDERRWRELWQLKMQAKYSWESLGLTAAEGERAKINKPDWI